MSQIKFWKHPIETKEILHCFKQSIVTLRYFKRKFKQYELLTLAKICPPTKYDDFHFDGSFPEGDKRKGSQKGKHLRSYAVKTNRHTENYDSWKRNSSSKHFATSIFRAHVSLLECTRIVPNILWWVYWSIDIQNDGCFGKLGMNLFNIFNPFQISFIKQNQKIKFQNPTIHIASEISAKRNH